MNLVKLNKTAIQNIKCWMSDVWCGRIDKNIFYTTKMNFRFTKGISEMIFSFFGILDVAKLFKLCQNELKFSQRRVLEKFKRTIFHRKYKMENNSSESGIGTAPPETDELEEVISH